MDISTLSLPLRKDRPQGSFFSVSPSITSVNVSYETAAAHRQHNEEQDDDVDESYAGPARTLHKSGSETSIKTHATSINDDSDPSSHSGVAKNSETAKASGHNSTDRPASVASSSPNDEAHELPTTSSSESINASHASRSSFANGTMSPLSVSPTGSTHEFPTKSPERDDTATDPSSISPNMSPSKSTRPQRARSSFSVASVECQNFVQSLKEPKYAKPLTADEIAWIFQDFYLKLRTEILGCEDELLTVEEQAARKRAEAEIDTVLDKAERAVTGGELYSKLLALGGSHDLQLQPRIDAIREHPELLVALSSALDLDGVEASEEDLATAVHYLNRLNKETSPKAKLAVLTKAHHAIVVALPRNSGNADNVFPLFVLALAKSTAVDWWQNFLFMQRFRRASELVGQAAYCLTNFEASIRVVEQFTVESVPQGVDANLLAKPLENPRTPRQRSSSQSSKGSSSHSSAAMVSLGQRLGDTLNSYRSMLATARKPQSHPASHTALSTSSKLSPQLSAQQLSAQPPAQPHQPQGIPSQTQPHPAVDQRFLHADADSLTLADVRVLLQEYKRLADIVESQS